MSQIIFNNQTVDLDTPAAGKMTLYSKVDKRLYIKDEDGTITPLSDTDVKVAVDSDATADYLGATGADGTLRVDTTLDYADGGDFVTLSLDSTLKTNYDAANAHITADGSSHTYIDQDVTSGSSPTLDGANITGITSGKADLVQITARKASAGTISAGRPVYVVSYNVSGYVEVEEADSSNAAEMPAVGIVEEDMTNGANGFVIIAGNLVGIDTSAYSVGDELYVSNGAVLTTTKPTGTDKIQKVAVVERSHATLGELIVIGAGRVNDIPNIASANFWLGNASGVATAVTMSGDATMDNAGAVTIAADAVTNAKMADMATNTIKGNDTGGSANPQDLSTTEVKALLDYSQPDIDQTINVQTGTSYTLVDADHGKLVTLGNASAISLSVNTGLRSDFQCVIMQKGAGQVTISGTATVNNIDSFSKTEEQYAFVNIIHLGSNVFVSDGRLVP